MSKANAEKEGQRHPIKLYLVVWGWLFILSTCSYLVDYLGFESYRRWFLILLFMAVKAGLIIAVFMHMAWERPALRFAIFAAPPALLVFVAIMAIEFEPYESFANAPLCRRRIRPKRSEDLLRS